MADELTFIIPLRKAWQGKRRYQRTDKALREIRAYAQRRLKTDQVRIGKYLNEHVWKQGNKKPPHHVGVTATKVSEKDKEYFKIELVGAPEDVPREEGKKGLAERLKEAVVKEETPQPEAQEKQEAFTEKEKEEILEKEPERKHEKKLKNVKPSTKEQEEKRRSEDIVRAPRKKRGDTTRK